MANHTALKNALNQKATPQNQVIPGREEDMAQNSAGGYSFTVDNWVRLDRFLVLGTEGGSYYASEQKLTLDNAKAVQKAIDENGLRAVQTIVEVSDSGRAPKNDPALFALALAASAKDPATRQAALAALPKVARIGTHLFHFAAYVENFRGWGRALRNAIANWYTEQDLNRLANQVTKYQQRDGWSHRDLLRLSHPKVSDDARNNVLRWVVKGQEAGVTYHRTIEGFEKAKVATSAKEIVALIREYNLPREAIPTEFLNDKKVWEALLENMPMTAMVRNLAKMTSIGLIAPMSDGTSKVLEQLGNKEAILKARVHPFQMLTALMTYKAGHGIRGSLSWSPVTQVTDALDSAFYDAFGNVTPTGKKHVIALDVSGSMNWDNMQGVPGLTPMLGSAAMALVTANVEKEYVITAFSSPGSRYGYNRSGQDTGGIQVLDISPKMRLDAVLKKVQSLNFGGTDCALPMLWAEKNKVSAEAFSVWTDSETWAGRIHPSQALKQYRKSTNPGAKLAVVGMVANDFSIADPRDGGMMDVVGFDTAAPNLMSDFFRG